MKDYKWFQGEIIKITANRWADVLIEKREFSEDLIGLIFDKSWHSEHGIDLNVLRVGQKVLVKIIEDNDDWAGADETPFLEMALNSNGGKLIDFDDF